MTAWAGVVGASPCVYGAGAAATRPARNADAPAPAAGRAVQNPPAPLQKKYPDAGPRDVQPGTEPRRIAAALEAPPRSEVGQRLVRQDGAGSTASTRPTTRAALDTAGSAKPPAPTLEVPKVAGALAIVLVLIFALRSVMRRAFPAGGLGGSSRAVQVLSRTVLSPKQQLMLVRVGRRLIVVADSAGQMNPLSEITDPDEVAELVGQVKEEKLSAAAPAFGGLLGRVRRGMEAAGAAGGVDRDSDVEEMPPAGNADRLRDSRDDGNGDGESDDPARQEINGLLAKVRLISHQFKGT